MEERLKALNVGSGQKPYGRDAGWLNMDINARWEPDILGDWKDLAHYVGKNKFDIVMAEQTVEHVGCGEANQFFKSAHEILNPGGSLIITVPDLRTLAQRWLTGQIDDFIYSVNLYGAFMGHDADRHRWNTSYEGWVNFLNGSASWSNIKRFDWREIPGCKVARDWWILGVEAIK